MVMRMTKYAGSNFLGKTLCRSFGELVVSVMLVSWWSLNCVSVVVGVLWHFGGVSVAVLGVFGDVFRYVLLISWWCFCGVSALLRWCFWGY